MEEERCDGGAWTHRENSRRCHSQMPQLVGPGVAELGLEETVASGVPYVVPIAASSTM